MAIPDVPVPVEEEIEGSAFARSLVDTPLSNQKDSENPITFGQRFDSDELEILSTLMIQTQSNQQFAAAALNGDYGEAVKNKFQNTEDKFNLYNRQPIEEDPNPFQLPEFIQNKIPFIPKQRKLQRELNSYGFSGRDQYRDPYANAMVDLGMDLYPGAGLVPSAKSIFTGQFPKDTGNDLTKSVRFLRNFYDRHLDPDELERMFIKARGYKPEEVDAQYLGGSENKKLGLVIKTPDTNGYEVFDQPYLTGFDILETIGTDSASWLGEYVARRYGRYKGWGKTTFSTGVTKSIFGRAREVAATGTQFGIGGATGEFARLWTGSLLDFNDYSMGEILDRSAMTGVIATGSVIAGDVAIRILTKLKDLPRGLVPDAVFKELKKSFEKAFNSGRKNNKKPPVVLVQGENGEWAWEEVAQETLDDVQLIDAEKITELITTKDIQDAVSKLLPDVNYTIEGKNKILNLGAALPRDQYVNDLEHIYLKNAKDPGIRKIYNAMIGGQKDVLNQFLYALNDATGATIDRNVSAADLAEDFEQIGVDRIQIIRDGQEQSLGSVLETLGGLEDDPGKIGKDLAAQIPSPRLGEGFMKRDEMQIKILKDEFLKPSFDKWYKAVGNEQYADLTTNARFIKFPTKEWKNIGEQYKFFQMEDAKDAKNSLYNILGVDSANKLRKLQGLGEVGTGGFVNPNFDMEEMNDMRVVLNKFATDTSNSSAELAARRLERGLERQMNFMVNSKASDLMNEERALSGLPKIPLNLNENNKNALALEEWKRTNKFGIDLQDTWTNLKRDIFTSKVINDTQGLQSNPENFVNNLVTNTPAFSKTYRNAEQLTYILDKTSSPLLDQLRRSTSAYIQNNVLGKEFATPTLKAKAFNDWAKKHQGLLKAVYPEDIFKKFTNFKQFQTNVIQPLAAADQKIVEIEQTFGNNNFTNLVTTYLDEGASFKRGGGYKKQQKFFLDAIKKDPILQNKVSSITKGWLLNTVMIRDPENVPMLDTDALNTLMTEGFGSKRTGNTFEDFLAPLIGKEGKQYVYNLEILNNITQRQAGMRESEATLADKSLTEPQTTFWERLFIAPLTQFGRRVTNLRNMTGDNSARLLAEMLLDPKKFDKVMKTRNRDLNHQEFARYLIANKIISGVALNNKLSSYSDSEEDKDFIMPDEITETVDTLDYIYNEVLPDNPFRGDPE